MYRELFQPCRQYAESCQHGAVFRREKIIITNGIQSDYHKYKFILTPQGNLFSISCLLINYYYPTNQPILNF